MTVQRAQGGEPVALPHSIHIASEAGVIDQQRLRRPCPPARPGLPLEKVGHSIDGRHLMGLLCVEVNMDALDR